MKPQSSNWVRWGKRPATAPDTAPAGTPPDTVMIEELTWAEVRDLVKAGWTNVLVGTAGTAIYFGSFLGTLGVDATATLVVTVLVARPRSALTRVSRVRYADTRADSRGTRTLSSSRSASLIALIAPARSPRGLLACARAT